MIKIAHIADIHWRGLSRHDEYKEVFDFFVNDAIKREVDCVVVAGDIFHTKTTGISPEYISELSGWLNNLARVGKVHLTLGNHDGNLVNLSRQDAVTPIVNALNNPNVSLYKNSSTVKLADNCYFHIFSLFDKESWNKLSPIEDKDAINIATFHGPVNGAQSETGWNIHGDLNVSDFDKFDIVMLGDIHKQQYLGYREIKSGKKPWIAYPGSTIQQNYAEDLDHGYLLWTINSSDDYDVEFIKLPNPKPFITINWNNSVEDTIKFNSIPNRSRVRIKSDIKIAQRDVHAITNLLKKNYACTEVAFKIDEILSKDMISSGNISLYKEDLRNINVITKLMHEYYKDAKIKEEDWNEIKEILKLCMLECTNSEDNVRNVKWSIKNLKFDNLFTYGSDNFINFESISGITGIFSQNRSGKSSVVGALMYALYNTSDRGSIKNLHIMNSRKEDCAATIHLSCGTKDLIIERCTIKKESKKGIQSANTVLNLYNWDNEKQEIIELNGEQRNDTEKLIRSIIGTSEDFMLTSLSAQGDINNFIALGSTQRRQILAKFLDLDLFDKMSETVKNKVNALKWLISSKDKNDSDKEKTYEISIKKCVNNLEKVNFELDACELQFHNLTLSVDSCKSELVKHSKFIPVTNADIELQKRKVDSLKLVISSEKLELASLKEKKLSLEEKIEKAVSILNENNIESLKEKESEYRKLEKSFLEVKHQYEKEDIKLKNIKKSLKILDDVPCGDSFPTCKFIKDAYTNKELLSNQIERVNKLSEKFKINETDVNDIMSLGITESLKKLQQILDSRRNWELEDSRLSFNLEKLQNSLSLKEIELVSLTSMFNELQKALDLKENVEVISLREKLELLNSNLKQLDRKRLLLSSEQGKAESDLIKIRAEKKEYDSTIHKIKIHELVLNAISKKGIPNMIVSSQLPIINSEISNILSGVVDFTIELEADSDSSSMEIYINYGDSRRIIELCSGMEKMISSLAIRVALINVSSLPKSDMFIIDEGFGVLDDSGIEACNQLLTSLKKYFKTIIVITHVDGIKDIADNILEITKNEKDSHIYYA